MATSSTSIGGGSMAGRKTELGDFEDGEGPPSFEDPPLVYLNAYTTTIRVPGDSGKLAGYTGIDPERGKVYITPRRRSQHYFKKHGGYAISTKVLAKALAQDAGYVLVYASDVDRTSVFEIDEYLDADDVPQQDVQSNHAEKCVDTARAIGTWEQKNTPIHDNR